MMYLDSGRHFYPRPPRGGRRRVPGRPSDQPKHFYPRPPRGGRRPSGGTASTGMHFYPRPPRGGRRCTLMYAPAKSTDFYPRPPRGGRQRCKTHVSGRAEISIHALREEGDNHRRLHGNPNQKFLSTPSARRATFRSVDWRDNLIYFYPRPPRGGRRAPISAAMSVLVFLSTPSARRATP